MQPACLRVVLVVFLSFSLFSILVSGACGGGNPALSIDPANPFVKKGATQQFTASDGPVVWSVDGGSANGAIDADGLYTAPSVLPQDALVTVRATTGDRTATASVQLVTADALSFSEPPDQVNMESDHRMDDEGLFHPGAQDRLALSQGGARVDATWGGGEVYFNQQLNFTGFVEDRILVTDVPSALALAVEEDRDGNPVILFNSGDTLLDGGRVRVRVGGDGGANFGEPVALYPSVPPTDFQFQASLAIDTQNRFHAVFTNGPNSGVGFFAIDGTLFYTTSENGGAAWSAQPSVVAAPAGVDDVIADPKISVDAEGNIYVCYSVDPDGAGVGEPFGIFFAKSVDGGASFPAQPLAPGSAANDLFCDFAIGPDGTIHVVYASGASNGSKVVFQKGSDGGATFSAPQAVAGNAAGDQRAPFVSVDALGRVSVVWAEDTDLDQVTDAMMLSRSLDGGGTFVPAIPIGGEAVEGADFVLGMGLRMDAAGRLHVLFASNALAPGSGADVFYLRGE